MLEWCLEQRLSKGTTVRELLEAYRDVSVAVVTFVFYRLGDIIDDVAFDWLLERFEELQKGKQLVTEPRNEVRNALGMQEDGEYRVAKGLADAADEYEGTRIQLCNEFAKFFRSAALLLFFYPLVLLLVKLPNSLLLSIAGGVLCFILYLALKPLHMRLLYKRVKCLIKRDEVRANENRESSYKYCDLREPGIRLFIWKGKFVASALRREGEASRGRTN